MDIVFCDVIGAAGDIYFIGTFYSDVLEKISFHPSVNYVKTTRLNHISQVEHDRNLIKLFLIRLFSKSFVFPLILFHGHKYTVFYRLIEPSNRCK